MHGLYVVHGDLKGVLVFLKWNVSTLTSHSPTKANILISKDRQARLADFGLSTITGAGARAAARDSPTSVISDDSLMSFTGGGTCRWMSPELLDPERFGIPQSEDNRPTRQSDCYALGMVIYEVRVSVNRFMVVNSCLTHTLGLMRTSPLCRHPLGSYSHAGDHGGGSARKIRESETSRIQRRTVEDY